MTYAEFFADIKGKFMEADVSSMTEHLAYQFNIEGEAGGIFYVEVKDGTLYVEPYEYFDRDAMFTAKAETFMKIASGKLDPILAVTLQKLKVEGNIEKAMHLKEMIDSKKKAKKEGKAKNAGESKNDAKDIEIEKEAEKESGAETAGKDK